MVTSLTLTCRYSSLSLACRDKEGKEIVIEPYKVLDGAIIYVVDGAPYTSIKYSIEVELPASYRIICNAPFYGELVWGKSRYVRWETENHVDKLCCLLSSFKVYDKKRFIIATKDEGGDVLADSELLLVETIINMLKNMFKWPTYSKYVVFPRWVGEHLDKPIAGVVRSDSIEESVGDVLYSSLVILGINNKPYVRWFVKNLTNLVLGKQSIFTPLQITVFRNIKSLTSILENPRRCVSIRQRGSYVDVTNTCDNRVLVLILGTKGVIGLNIDEQEHISISSSLVGEVIDYSSITQ